MKRIKITILIFLTITLIGCGVNKDLKENKSNPTNDSKIEYKIEDKKKVNIDKKEIIDKLCSNEFEGRLVGSKGNKLAEDYIAYTFKDIGVEPLMGNEYYHTYTQEITTKFGLIEPEDILGDREVNNIVGKISGKDNTKAIVLSAHFDHIGKQNEDIIKGAVDNASGVSVLIDLADKLVKSSKENKFPYDIIICSFNGEEGGQAGSKEFIKSCKDMYKDLFNINIDSVGYKNSGSMVFLNSNDKYNNIYDKLELVLNENNIQTSRTVDNKIGFSDSNNFELEGIKNVCLIEENVKEVIHSPKDVEEVIDYNRLDCISKSVYEFITKYAFEII